MNETQLQLSIGSSLTPQNQYVSASYARINLPPIRPTQPVFVFPSRQLVSCISINVSVLHSLNGVRKTICHDLISQGFGHGFIRRLSNTEVEVKIVIPASADIDLNDLSRYFFTKWIVDAESFIVRQNTDDVSYLRRGFIVYKSGIPDVEGHSLDEDLDDVSVDGYSVISDKY